MRTMTIREAAYSVLMRGFCAMTALTIHHGNAHAAPPTQESTILNEKVLPVDLALAAVRTGLGDLVAPDSITIQESDAGIPQRLFFVEGKPGTSAEESPVLTRVQTIARNYRLELEYQKTTLDDGAPLFGFLIFEPFDMLRFYWTIHPFESVEGAGRWTKPVADLCDVESMQIAGSAADLVLTEGAARRLDRLSMLHGHRVLTMNTSGPSERTWLPGLRTIPRVDVAQLRQISHLPDNEADLIPAQVRIHAIARRRIIDELGLSHDVSWNVMEKIPLYTQPVYLQLLYAPERDTYSIPFPPIGRISPDTTWCEMGNGSIVVPRQWTWKALAAGGSLVRNSPGTPDLEIREQNFFSLLEANVGRRAALVVNGRVAGIVAVESARQGQFNFESMSSEVVQMVAAAWRSAGGPIEVPEPAAKAESDAQEDQPDTFQVRLMAEPQDREYVAVTHFEAPGATRGIQVAVRKEIILDGRAVTGAAMEADGVTLHLTFTPEAQEALGGACFANMGKQLAILYKDRLLCAPTIDEWEIEDLSFKGMDIDWPEVAKDLAEHLAAKG